MTCRVFGPPVRSEDGLGVCELCYHGASDEQIAACEMPVPSGLEAAVVEEAERASGQHGPDHRGLRAASEIVFRHGEHGEFSLSFFLTILRVLRASVVQLPRPHCAAPLPCFIVDSLLLTHHD